MNKPEQHQDILTYISSAALESAHSWPWVLEKLTIPRAQAFILQHIPRNRFFSSVSRPAWMSRCPDQAIVRKTIGQMCEELVYDPGAEMAHTQMLWQMGHHIGLTDAHMNACFDRIEAKTAASFALMEDLARNRHWIVGWLGSSIDEFVLTQLEGHNIGPDSWKRDLGLTEEQVYFFTYHQTADLEHAGTRVWEPIKPYVTDEVVTEIRSGLEIILIAQKMFYEGVMDHAARIEAGEILN